MTPDFLPALAAIPAIAPMDDPAPGDPIRGMAAGDAVARGQTPGAPAGASFGDLVRGGLDQVSAQLQASQVDLQRLAAGEAENLHQVMLRLEESRLSFQLMLQVRNRLLESYQDVMRMQV